jgi:adenosylhomocysteine nucleosidase
MTRRYDKKIVTKLTHLWIGILLLLFPGYAYPGTIGFFFALDEDKSAFEAAAGNPIRTMNLVGGTVAFEYRVGAHRVIAAKMGSGCVNTAVTVARVLALNPVDRIISTGPAGAIGDQAGIGTWYRIGEVAAWQQGRAGEGGRVFPSESALRKVSWKPDDWPDGRWKQMPATKLVSGEVFVASGEKRGELARGFGAELVEMNAFGLLEAAEGTPAKVLILRVVSDKADEKASEDFSAFLKAYDGAGGKMVAELVKALPVGKDEPAAHDALRELIGE